MQSLRPPSRQLSQSLHFTNIAAHMHFTAWEALLYALECREAEERERAPPTGRPEWPEQPQLGARSWTLGSFAEDFGLYPN